MTLRTAIPDFTLARPLYRGSLVSFYTVDEDGEATSTLATLYAAPTGSTTLNNPQRLDAVGKFQAPVYIDSPVVGEVVGRNVSSHSTGIINARGTWRGTWETGEAYFSSDLVIGPGTGNLYVVVDDHAAGASFAADLAAGHFELVFDATFADPTQLPEPLQITGASATIAADTIVAAIVRSAPSTTAITLGAVAARAGAPLFIFDWSSGVTDHTITITPNGSETIMKSATWPLFSNAASLAGVRLNPSTTLAGWWIAP